MHVDRTAECMQVCMMGMLLTALQEVECRNHIRAVFRVFNSDEFCICGTGAHSPQEQFLNVTHSLCTSLLVLSTSLAHISLQLREHCVNMIVTFDSHP